MKKTEKRIKASELDRIFDDGKEDVMQYMDPSTVRVDFPVQRINIDIPQVILKKVDREAARVGVTRTSLLKVWIAEYVDRLSAA